MAIALLMRVGLTGHMNVLELEEEVERLAGQLTAEARRSNQV